MVEKVERYKTHDGREFLTQEAALRHEAIEAMIAEVPELMLIRTKLESSMNRISFAVEPLARFLAKTTPEAPAQTTLEPCHPDYDHAEQSGLCDCSAGMSGASDHHVSCPAHVHIVKLPMVTSHEQARERGFPTGPEMARRVSFRG